MLELNKSMDETSGINELKTNDNFFKKEISFNLISKNKEKKILIKEIQSKLEEANLLNKKTISTQQDYSKFYKANIINFYTVIHFILQKCQLKDKANTSILNGINNTLDSINHLKELNNVNESLIQINSDNLSTMNTNRVNLTTFIQNNIDNISNNLIKINKNSSDILTNYANLNLNKTNTLNNEEDKNTNNINISNNISSIRNNKIIIDKNKEVITDIKSLESKLNNILIELNEEENTLLSNVYTPESYNVSELLSPNLKIKYNTILKTFDGFVYYLYNENLDVLNSIDINNVTYTKGSPYQLHFNKYGQTDDVLALDINNVQVNTLGFGDYATLKNMVVDAVSPVGINFIGSIRYAGNNYKEIRYYAYNDNLKESFYYLPWVVKVEYGQENNNLLDSISDALVDTSKQYSYNWLLDNATKVVVI